MCTYIMLNSLCLIAYQLANHFASWLASYDKTVYLAVAISISLQDLSTAHVSNALHKRYIKESQGK